VYAEEDDDLSTVFVICVVVASPEDEATGLVRASFTSAGIAWAEVILLWSSREGEEAIGGGKGRWLKEGVQGEGTEGAEGRGKDEGAEGVGGRRKVEVAGGRGRDERAEGVGGKGKGEGAEEVWGGGRDEEVEGGMK